MYIRGFYLVLLYETNVILTDEELENRQKNEYQSYVDDENSFLRELGILKDEDPLPET